MSKAKSYTATCTIKVEAVTEEEMHGFFNGIVGKHLRLDGHDAVILSAMSRRAV